MIALIAIFIATINNRSVAFLAPNVERNCAVDNPRLSSLLYSQKERDWMITDKQVTRSCFVQSLLAMTSFPHVANSANMPKDNGADLSKTGSIDTLVPILEMRQSILAAQSLLSQNKQSSSSCSTLLKELLQAIPREERQFKRILDAYSTPVSYKQKFLDQNAFMVYYSKGFDGPGRPNIENDGDDVTNSIQTMQYGFRNEAWTAVDDLFTELEFGTKGSDNSVDLNDLCEFMSNALKAFDSYLNLVPENDIKEASVRIAHN